MNNRQATTQVILDSALIAIERMRENLAEMAEALSEPEAIDTPPETAQEIRDRIRTIRCAQADAFVQIAHMLDPANREKRNE